MTTFASFTLNEVLEDLTSRFIINVPDKELESIERVIFQIELAHWFYEDFVREENPKLPTSSLKNFSRLLFQSCILLRHWAADHERAYTTFMEYKVKVPVCGAIILNSDLTKVLLVRGWKTNSSWGFPRGKINQDEAETSCAIREVFEETGFDASNYFRANEYVEKKINDQRMKLYIISGIEESVEFATQTRKEIGDIKWHSLSSIPGFNAKEKDGGDAARASSSDSHHTNNKKYKFYMVSPFLAPVRRWIGRFKDAKNTGKDRKKAGLKMVIIDNNTNAAVGTDGNESDAEVIAVASTGGHVANINEYNSAIVPQNQRVELEDSLKSLLGMSTHPNNNMIYPHQQQQQQQQQHQQQFPYHYQPGIHTPALNPDYASQPLHYQDFVHHPIPSAANPPEIPSEVPVNEFDFAQFNNGSQGFAFNVAGVAVEEIVSEQEEVLSSSPPKQQSSPDRARKTALLDILVGGGEPAAEQKPSLAPPTQPASSTSSPSKKKTRKTAVVTEEVTETVPDPANPLLDLLLGGGGGSKKPAAKTLPVPIEDGGVPEDAISSQPQPKRTPKKIKKAIKEEIVPPSPSGPQFGKIQILKKPGSEVPPSSAAGTETVTLKKKKQEEQQLPSTPSQPVPGKIQILKRPAHASTPIAPEKEKEPKQSVTILQNTSRKQEPPSEDSLKIRKQTQKPVILARKNSHSESQGLVDLLMNGDGAGNNNSSSGSRDPGLELALQGMVKPSGVTSPILTAGVIGVDKGLDSILNPSSTSTPAVRHQSSAGALSPTYLSNASKEKQQSLLDILKGTPLPPSQPADSIEYSRPSSPKRGASMSMTSPVGRSGSPLKSANIPSLSAKPSSSSMVKSLSGSSSSGLLELLLMGGGGAVPGAGGSIANSLSLFSGSGATPKAGGGSIPSFISTKTPSLLSASPRSPFSPSSANSQQSLLDILSGIPKPPSVVHDSSSSPLSGSVSGGPGPLKPPASNLLPKKAGPILAKPSTSSPTEIDGGEKNLPPQSHELAGKKKKEGRSASPEKKEKVKEETPKKNVIEEVGGKVATRLVLSSTGVSGGGGGKGSLSDVFYDQNPKIGSGIISSSSASTSSPMSSSSGIPIASKMMKQALSFVKDEQQQPIVTSGGGGGGLGLFGGLKSPGAGMGLLPSKKKVESKKEDDGNADEEVQEEEKAEKKSSNMLLDILLG